MARRAAYNAGEDEDKCRRHLVGERRMGEQLDTREDGRAGVRVVHELGERVQVVEGGQVGP